jgi:hypothetical protein
LLSYEQWLAQSAIDNQRKGGTAAAEVDRKLSPGSAGTMEAEYIARCIRDHHENKTRVISGLRIVGLTVRGDLHLENYVIPFPVFFEACHFPGNLHIWRMRARTLSFDGSIISGGVELRGTELDGHLLLRNGFVAEGPIVARDMKVSDSVDVTGANFAYEGSKHSAFSEIADGESFGFSRSTAKALYWRNLSAKPAGKITFRDTSVGSLIHDLDADPALRSWPAEGDLILDGFKYARIDDCETERAIAWLELQDHFAASSYTALANAFERVGLRQKAEDVLAAFKRAEIGQIRNPLKRWIVFLVYWAIGYGQRPHRALFYLVLLFTVHLAIVVYAKNTNEMRPEVNSMLTEACFYGPGPDCDLKKIRGWPPIPLEGKIVRYVPPDYPSLSPIEYTLESFIPIFDLSQRAYWQPSSALVRIVLTTTAALGIFLSGLFAGAIAGMFSPSRRSD